MRSPPTHPQLRNIVRVRPHLASTHFLGVEFKLHDLKNQYKAYSKKRGTAPRHLEDKDVTAPDAHHPPGLVTEGNAAQTVASGDNTMCSDPPPTDSFAQVRDLISYSEGSHVQSRYNNKIIPKLNTEANEARATGKKTSTNGGDERSKVKNGKANKGKSAGCPEPRHHGQRDHARPQAQEAPRRNAAQLANDAWLAHLSQNYRNLCHLYSLMPLQPWCWYQIPSGTANPTAAPPANTGAPTVPAQAAQGGYYPVRTTQNVVAWVQVPVIAAPGWPNYVWVPVGAAPYPASYPSSYAPTAPAHGGHTGPAPAAYAPAAPSAIQPQDAYYHPRQHEGVEFAAAEHAPTHSPAMAAQHSDDQPRIDDASLPLLSPTTATGQFNQDYWRNWENENQPPEDRVFWQP